MENNNSTEKKPVIRMTNGLLDGMEIPVTSDEEIIVGRDAAVCHIVINSDRISRRHLGISFDESRGVFRITDYSTNGTFLDGSRKMENGETVTVPRGTMIGLGDRMNCLRVE